MRYSLLERLRRLVSRLFLRGWSIWINWNKGRRVGQGIKVKSALHGEMALLSGNIRRYIGTRVKCK